MGKVPKLMNGGFYVVSGNFRDGASFFKASSKAFVCVGDKTDTCPCRNCVSKDDVLEIFPNKNNMITMSQLAPVEEILSTSPTGKISVALYEPEKLHPRAAASLLKSVEDFNFWDKVQFILIPKEIGAVSKPLISRSMRQILEDSETDGEWSNVSKYVSVKTLPEWKEVSSFSVALLGFILQGKTKESLKRVMSITTPERAFAVAEALGFLVHEVLAFRAEVPNSVKTLSQFDKIKALADIKLEDLHEAILHGMQKVLDCNEKTVCSMMYAQVTFLVSKASKK